MTSQTVDPAPDWRRRGCVAEGFCWTTLYANPYQSYTAPARRSRGERPVGFTSFDSETDRSFATNKLEMTPLCLNALSDRRGVWKKSFFWATL
ncbi:hypothetical protein L596_030290 [Steinernema carpocapsae]|uniref:Uncharacterized protein n=1 Tax=Steinernema carpocapsae TaxID=34508 RepID=A0A4U5LNY3_STECR|nr:hypothetical protein L596_030290 [Steinernema carpocapsae]